MESLTNCQDVVIAHGLKTLEFEISYSNVSNISSKIYENALYKYLKMCQKENIDVVDAYLTSLKKQELSDDDKFNVAILIWKSMPPKSEFAQDFSTYLECHRQDDDFQFNVPQYISDAICSLTTT